MSGTVPDFTRDPLGFMSRHPVWPVPGIRVPDTAEFGVDDLTDDSCLRVAFAPNPLRGAGALQLIERAGGFVLDARYLKWASRRITKLRLPNAGIRRFFFTSAINGCSVFVSGNENAPTVYHAGIDGSVNEDLASSDRLNIACKRAARAGDAPLFWRTLLAQREPLTNIDAEVNKTHYISDGTLVNDPGFKSWFAWASKPTTALGKEFGNKLWWAGVRGAEVIPWGTFWGMKERRATGWRFYLQANATVVKADRTMKGVVMQLKRVFPTENIEFTHDGKNV